jgi:hypothetical protein
VRAAGRATRDVLERAVALVDVDEVEERLHQTPVVEVPVPALGRDAIGVLGLGDGIPEVDVLELRPEPEVRVRDVEHPPREARSEPRVVEAEVDSVAQEPDHELLAGAHTERLAISGQGGLRLGHEELGLALDPRPDVVVLEELSEGEEREALGLELRDDPALNVVELGTVVRELAPAATVREDAIVQRVGRTHAAPLERGRDVVHACREACFRPVHGRLNASGCSSVLAP